MTKYEIIKMAWELGLEHIREDVLERFAKLVAAKEREKWEGQTEVEIHEAVLEEREACAKVCETFWDTPTNGMATEEEAYGEKCAAAIRARGQPRPKEDTTDAEWIARCLAASTIPKEFRTKEFK